MLYLTVDTAADLQTMMMSDTLQSQALRICKSLATNDCANWSNSDEVQRVLEDTASLGASSSPSLNRGLHSAIVQDVDYGVVHLARDLRAVELPDVEKRVCKEWYARFIVVTGIIDTI